MHELHNNAVHKTLLAPVTVSATGQSAAIDMQGHRWAELIFSVGDFTFTGTNKITLSIQEADESDFSDAAAPSDYDAPGATSGVVATLDASAEKEKSYRVGYIGTKRYARLVYTIGGTVSCPCSAIGVAGGTGDFPKSTADLA